MISEKLLRKIQTRYIDSIRTHSTKYEKQKFYSVELLMWLMIWHRFHAERSLVELMNEVQSEWTQGLSGDCKRKRSGKMSTNPSAFCQARQELDYDIVEELVEALLSQLREGAPLWEGQYEVVILDGTSLRLPRSDELFDRFPPGKNQNGVSYNPELRLVIAHSVFSGLGYAPVWAARNGQGQKSEQVLAKELLARFKENTVIMGDANFGKFSVAWAAYSRQQNVVVRLQESIAKRLLGCGVEVARDGLVTWTPSKKDLESNPELPEGCDIQGRVIVRHLSRNGKRESVVLFTTFTQIPAEKLVELYAKRWNIETDIRSLKHVIKFSDLRGRSVDVIEKEILCGTAAYNLVRAYIVILAQHYNCTPRELSFKTALGRMTGLTSRLISTTDEEERMRLWDKHLDTYANCRLPKREKPRKYPRVKILQRDKYPTRTKPYGVSE